MSITSLRAARTDDGHGSPQVWLRLLWSDKRHVVASISMHVMTAAKKFTVHASRTLSKMAYLLEDIHLLGRGRRFLFRSWPIIPTSNLLATNHSISQCTRVPDTFLESINVALVCPIACFRSCQRQALMIARFDIVIHVGRSTKFESCILMLEISNHKDILRVPD